jgi:hypothetical protein
MQFFFLFERITERIKRYTASQFPNSFITS